MNGLRRIRRAKGLTQIQLAELAGVDQATISKIESGKRGGSLETYAILADAMKVSLADLFADDLDEGEKLILNAFRHLSPERKLFWLDMARAVHAEGGEEKS